VGPQATYLHLLTFVSTLAIKAKGLEIIIDNILSLCNHGADISRLLEVGHLQGSHFSSHESL
jgi:hypothetical protein